MSFDPFEAEVSTVGVTPETAQEICEDEPATEEELADAEEQEWTYRIGPVAWREEGKVFAYDLETVPDETRFPKPEEKVIEPRDIDFMVALKTVGTLEAELALGVTPEQANALLEAERDGKKPRKGAIEALQKYIDGGDEEMQRWKKLSLDPARCRIVAYGTCTEDGEPVATPIRTLDEEREVIYDHFSRIAAGHIRVGFNTLAFDERVFFWRALQLRVKVPVRVKLNRFSTPECIDLMSSMFRHKDDSIKLKRLLRMVGITPPAGDVDGSHVLEMVEGAQWDELCKYVASDAWSEMQLYLMAKRVLVI